MSERPITFKADIKIHNRFDIEVRDKDTGALKQKGYAENILLDRAYTRVCNFSTYFSYIHFGTGTGDLSVSRTSLFAPLGNKLAVIDSSVNAYPVSKVTKKITLNPEEYVDKEITEVGISESSSTSAMNTHALIKDAEGNPLSINKTALDVVVIYATVFINFENPSDDFIFTSFPRNQIAKYFIDHTNISNVIKAEKGIEFGFSTTRETGSNTGTRVVNTATRKTTINTRFATTQANGEVKSVGLFESLKVRFPAVGIYSGVNLEGIILGVGDGANKKFEIPNLSPTALTVKNNNNIVTNYEQDISIWVEQHKQNLTGVGNIGYGAVFSPDGKTVITASSNAPYFTVQTLNEITGDFEYKQNLTGVGNNGRGVAISTDGKTVITASYNAPYFTVQILNESTGDFEYKQTLTGVGAGGRGVVISTDGKTVITASSNAPYFTIQTLNETTGDFEHKQNLTGAGTNGYGVSISSDGKTVITASDSAPYFTIQTLNETTGDFEYKQNLTGVGTGGYGVAISTDGKTVITASGNAPYFTVQTLNEITGEYEYKQSLAGVGNYGRGVAISPDGKTVITASSSAPYFTVQALNEITGEYEYKQSLAGVGSNGYGVAISPDGKTVITASYGAPYFTVQTLNESKHFIIFDTPPASDDIITADYHVAHIPKSEDYVLDVAFELQFGEGI